MKANFTVSCQDTFEFSEFKKPGKQDVEHIESKLMLDVDFPLDQDAYYGKDNYLNKDGCEVVTRVLINAVMGNLHYSHQRGFRDSAEHLRFVIGEMEKLFVEVAQIKP